MQLLVGIQISGNPDPDPSRLSGASLQVGPGKILIQVGEIIYHHYYCQSQLLVVMNNKIKVKTLYSPSQTLGTPGDPGITPLEAADDMENDEIVKLLDAAQSAQLMKVLSSQVG